MPTDNTPDTQRPPAAAATRRRRTPRNDRGASILPTMEHFVRLLRHVRCSRLAVDLLEAVSQAPLTQLHALTHKTGVLCLASRQCIFHVVDRFEETVQQQIERLAERVLLLTDEAGAQAVLSLLDTQREDDAALMAHAGDRFSRTLHLCLLQEFPKPGAQRDGRFDHAEHLQLMHRQWRSEQYSSHYLGTRGVLPATGAHVHEALRQRLIALFPQRADAQILIEQFTRRDLARREDHSALGMLHTLTATFNGSTAFFQQVAHGQLVDHEEPAALSIRFSWEPHSGALSVFCKDRSLRHALAIAFRDNVLTHGSRMNPMPIRVFDLSGFADARMLKRLESERMGEIERITLLQLKLAHRLRQPTHVSERALDRPLSSQLEITRDRRDPRTLYQIAYEDYGLDNLGLYDIVQVKMVMRMAAQPHRQAHNVSVQITAPNGLNDRSKTHDDRRRVLAQLCQQQLQSDPA